VPGPVAAARGHHLTLRFALPLLLVLLGAAAALAYQCNVAINRTLAEAAERRAAVVLLDIAQGIETRLNLGLPIATMYDIQEVVERERAKDGQILSIEVFDDAGRSLFNTDRGLIGDRVPPAWVELTRDQHRGLWITSDFEAAVVGTDFTNSFNKTVGGVALRYSSDAFRAMEREALTRVSAGAAVIALAAAMVLLVGVALVLQPYNAALRQAMESFGTQRDGDAVLPGSEPRTIVLLGDVARVRRTVLEADGALRSASTEVQRIDEDA